MGKVLTPLLSRDGADGRDLPGASTLCGACTEACPVQIPLADLLVRLRGRSPLAGPGRRPLSPSPRRGAAAADDRRPGEGSDSRVLRHRRSARRPAAAAPGARAFGAWARPLVEPGRATPRSTATTPRRPGRRRVGGRARVALRRAPGSAGGPTPATRRCRRPRARSATGGPRGPKAGSSGESIELTEQFLLASAANGCRVHGPVGAEEAVAVAVERTGRTRPGGGSRCRSTIRYVDALGLAAALASAGTGLLPPNDVVAGRDRRRGGGRDRCPRRRSPRRDAPAALRARAGRGRRASSRPRTSASSAPPISSRRSRMRSRCVVASAHPSAMSWVGGPSRTADLEMRQTFGVHGPKAVDVVVVATASGRRPQPLGCAGTRLRCRSTRPRARGRRGRGQHPRAARRRAARPVVFFVSPHFVGAFDDMTDGAAPAARAGRARRRDRGRGHRRRRSRPSGCPRVSVWAACLDGTVTPVGLADGRHPGRRRDRRLARPRGRGRRGRAGRTRCCCSRTRSRSRSRLPRPARRRPARARGRSAGSRRPRRARAATASSLDARSCADGAVGVFLGGATVGAVVSQGCRPVGSAYIVTDATTTSSRSSAASADAGAARRSSRRALSDDERAAAPQACTSASSSTSTRPSSAAATSSSATCSARTRSRRRRSPSGRTSTSAGPSSSRSATRSPPTRTSSELLAGGDAAGRAAVHVHRARASTSSASRTTTPSWSRTCSVRCRSPARSARASSARSAGGTTCTAFTASLALFED